MELFTSLSRSFVYIGLNLLLSCVGAREPNHFLVNAISPGSALKGFIFIGKEAFPFNGKSRSVDVYRHQGTSMDFILVQGANFANMSFVAESMSQRAEGLLPFLIARTEVTQSAWDKLMGSNSSLFKGPDYPVTNVSWNDAQEWCEKAGLRLPTEAEWVFSFEVGSTFKLDSSDIGDHAWYDKNSNRSVWPVGRKLPNALGLYDMIGNVAEWVQDSFPRSKSGEDLENVRIGFAHPPDRVLLGGCSLDSQRFFMYGFRGPSLDPQDFFASGFRSAAPPSGYHPFTGFRPAATPVLANQKSTRSLL